jgi:hypothetical protein
MACVVHSARRVRRADHRGEEVRSRQGGSGSLAARAASSLGMFTSVGGNLEEARDPQRGASGNENAAPGSRVNEVTPGDRAAIAA